MLQDCILVSFEFDICMYSIAMFVLFYENLVYSKAVFSSIITTYQTLDICIHVSSLKNPISLHYRFQLSTLLQIELPHFSINFLILIFFLRILTIWAIEHPVKRSNQLFFFIALFCNKHTFQTSIQNSKNIYLKKAPFPT